ncbi:MAG: hypothetical protein U0531_07110 [Dehalococcoidia bacterium]
MAGTNPRVDEAVRLLPAINAFLRQRPAEAAVYEQTVQALRALAQT